MNDKPKCGCEKCKKYRKMAGIAECFENKANALGIFEAYTFQKNKPFKVTFNEDINVTWNSLSEKTEMTEKDVKQKGEYMDILKAKMPEFKKRYGKKALDVMGGVAAKQAIRTPD
jgi:trehalose/maltose hydrolase-like predicted phosphorylase